MTTEPIELSGKTIVLTGKFSLMTRKEAAAALEARGANISSSVNGGTDILFAGEKAGSKKKKAESLGVAIHSEAALAAALKGEAAATSSASTTGAPSGSGPAVFSGEHRDIADGEIVLVQGSGAKPYQLKNIGGVYSCSCPAWRNQSVPIERRSCKHLVKVRGHEAEQARIGDPALAAPSRSGEDKDKPPVLLAHSWKPEDDPTGWWMSEKLDGVRAWWNGEVFLSRLGNRYMAPDWFTAGLPATPLDGELWMARGAFQRTISVVRRHDGSDHWKQIRFLVFDAPEHDGDFEARVEWLKRSFGGGVADYVQVVEHARCDGVAHLKTELARVEGLSGEGLMLRQPGSRYVAGRSTTLLKVKSFFDAEAKVLGYKAGAGRHKGRVGALNVVTPDGVEFAVGTGLSDKQRENPPPVGAVISYRYQELTDGGVPRFPTFLGVRHDYAWPEEPRQPV